MTTMQTTRVRTISMVEPKVDGRVKRKRPAKGVRKSARSRKRPIATEDLLKFQIVSDPQMSPDGKHVLFTHKRAGEKNKYETNLWIVPTDGSSPPRPFMGPAIEMVSMVSDHVSCSSAAFLRGTKSLLRSCGRPGAHILRLIE
jgi:hypothetical protein